jgi:catechol 2,3-dioxygenase-like lactoylglutathione lyase family enzyme
MSETTAKTNTWAKSIFAVTLFVEDLETCKQFYQKVFDLPITFADDEGNSAVFKFGDVLINLLKVSEAPELIHPASVAKSEAGSRFVITIPVDDVDALCEQLRSHGVELLNGPMDRPWGPRTASFKDPAGYIWEIAQQRR